MLCYIITCLSRTIRIGSAPFRMRLLRHQPIRSMSTESCFQSPSWPLASISVYDFAIFLRSLSLSSGILQKEANALPLSRKILFPFILIINQSEPRSFRDQEQPSFLLCLGEIAVCSACLAKEGQHWVGLAHLLV